MSNASMHTTECLTIIATVEIVSKQAPRLSSNAEARLLVIRRRAQR
jgi:hypothetical protein